METQAFQGRGRRGGIFEVNVHAEVEKVLLPQLIEFTLYSTGSPTLYIPSRHVKCLECVNLINIIGYLQFYTYGCFTCTVQQEPEIVLLIIFNIHSRSILFPLPFSCSLNCDSLKQEKMVQVGCCAPSP